MSLTRPDKEVITPEGYALAPLFLRAVAMAVDAALASALIAGLYFALFNPLSKATGINSDTDKLINYRLDGGLMVEDSDGMVHDVNGSEYKPYQEAVEKYYLVYNAPDSTLCPEPLNFDVAKYNEEILKLPKPGLTSDSYFVYQKDSYGENDYTKVGIIKEYYFVDHDRSKGLSEEGKTVMLTFYQEKYNEAYTSMTDSSYYQAIMGPMQWKTKLLMSAMAFPSLIAVYALPALIFKNGATLGKKLMKLCVCSVEGFDLAWWRKLLRVAPLLVSCALFLFVDDLFVSFPMVGAFFLISLGFGLFTKRRQAVHDIMLLTVVAREDVKKEEVCTK
ncbi:MAG: RDD family protein [Bacilli bacterium]|nr:RDD family protein [Bacilli bacterium]